MKKQFKSLISVVVILVILCSLFSCSESKELKVFFSDNMITVSSGDELCVIGCGNGKLDDFENEDIEYLIIQDFGENTIGSFKTLADNYEIKHIYIPDYIPEKQTYNSFMELCYEEDSYIVYVEGSMSFAVGDGSVTVSAGNSTNYEDKKDYSLMTTVSLSEKRMLICGSAKQERITEFLDLESRTYSYIALSKAQNEAYTPLLEKLSPESVIFTDCESYVKDYDVYDTSKGPIIFEG